MLYIIFYRRCCFKNSYAFTKIIIRFIFLLSACIIILLLVVQRALSNQGDYSDPQLTSLESGFEGLRQGLIMSSSFFLLAVLFVLFDIELVLLFPGALFHQYLREYLLLSLWLILFLVLVTLIIEWAWCGLKWHS